MSGLLNQGHQLPSPVERIAAPDSRESWLLDFGIFHASRLHELARLETAPLGRGRLSLQDIAGRRGVGRSRATQFSTSGITEGER